MGTFFFWIFLLSLFLRLFFGLYRKVEGPRAPRDERRRAQHNEGRFASQFEIIVSVLEMFYKSLRPILSRNESPGHIKLERCPVFIFKATLIFAVERRRRDKINNWIVTLSKIIPDCSVDSRTGAVSAVQTKSTQLCDICVTCLCALCCF